MKVKQLHRVMPLEIREIIDWMTQELKGERFFHLLEPRDQWDIISTLCDNPTEWLDMYNKEDFEPENLPRHEC